MNKDIAQGLMRHFFEEMDNAQARSGCNDFNLSRFIPRREDRQAFMKLAHELNGDPEVFEQDNAGSLFGRDYDIVHDGLVFLVLKNYLEALVTKNG